MASKPMRRGRNKIHEKPKNFKKTLFKLLGYKKSLIPLFIFAFIFAIASSVLTIIGPNKISNLTDAIGNGIKSGMDFNYIKNISLILLIIYALSTVFNYLNSAIMSINANKLAKNLRQNISKKINNLPLKYFDNHPLGDTLSRVTNDVDTIASTISNNFGTFISAIALLFACIFMMFFTNWILSLTAILSTIIGFVFLLILTAKSQKYFNDKQYKLGNINGHIEEMYSGYNVVRAYNAKNTSLKKFNQLNQELFDCSLKSEFLSGLMQPIMNFVGNLSYVSVCVVGAILTANGVISFGVIVAFIIYCRLFTSPLSQIAQGITDLQSATAAGERVFEFLEEPEMANESHKTKWLNRNEVNGNIEFKNVKFGYVPEKIIIKDFSCKVNAGQKIAIVGPTGAGKTTLVNLLMRFYELNDGDITIDGVSIKDITRENLHDLFIMVLQDTWLFNGTIRENIVYNKKDVSDEEINSVINLVGLGHFIKSLPHGLDTVINDTESISAGQKQLITIARGMIEGSPFLILDEATSNVDTRTEEIVQKAMDKLTEGRTSFIIAHRLSTIKNADLILVMKDGNVVEQGNHNQLIELNGLYADLYNSQFKLK